MYNIEQSIAPDAYSEHWLGSIELEYLGKMDHYNVECGVVHALNKR